MSTLRPQIAWIILKKEALEILRDRKTLFLIIGIPLLLYPMLGIVTSEIAMGQAAKIKAQPSRVALLGAPTPKDLLTRLQNDPDLRIISPPPNHPKDALQERTLDATIHTPDTFAAEYHQNQPASLSISYDSTQPLSQQALQRLQEHTTQWNDATRDTILQKHNLSPTILKPILLDKRDVAAISQKGTISLVNILPLFILVFMVTGAFYPAVDLTAGERERKTIQTLLTSPIQTLEIVAGKYLIVVAMALICGLANLFSIALLMAYGASLAPSGLAGLSLDATPSVYLGLVLCVALFGALIAAVLISIASFSARPKDAQSSLTIAYILAILPATIAVLPGFELNHVTSLIPVMNLSLLMRAIVLSQATLSQVFIVTLITGVYTFLALLMTAKVYARQDILIQEQSSPRQWLSASPQDGSQPSHTAPPLDLSLALLGLLVLLLFYIGSLLQSWHLLGGLALTLWGLILLPCILFTKLTRSDWKTTFHLHAPSPLQLAGAGLLGVSAFIWLSALLNIFHGEFLPIPEPFIKAMENIFTMPEDIGGKILVFLVMAVSPAICEEALFRGVLLSSLRTKAGMWVSIIVSGLLFGLFHLSIYRLLGTATLGILMGYLVWKSRSIWPAVLFHALNNGMSIFTQDLRKALTTNESYILLAASIATTLAGLGLFKYASKHDNDPTTPNNNPTPLR